MDWSTTRPVTEIDVTKLLQGVPVKLSSDPRANKPARVVACLAMALVPFMLNACSSDASSDASTDAIGPDTSVVTDATVAGATTDAPTQLAAVIPDSTAAPQAPAAVPAGSTVPSKETIAAKAETPVKTPVNASAAPTPTAVRSNPDVDANAIPKLKNEVGALADVAVKSCAKAPSGADVDWTSAGSVTNSSKAVASYVITTAFLDAKGTTVGLGFITVDRVNAGSSRQWAVTAQTTVGEGLQCIMRVTRGGA